MEKKESSVEQKAFKSSLDYLLYYLPSAIRGQFKEQIEQAKAMHKEEIVDSILDNRNITSQVTFKDAETYYNERF